MCLIHTSPVQYCGPVHHRCYLCKDDHDMKTPLALVVLLVLFWNPCLLCLWLVCFLPVCVFCHFYCLISFTCVTRVFRLCVPCCSVLFPGVLLVFLPAHRLLFSSLYPLRVPLYLPLGLYLGFLP